MRVGRHRAACVAGLVLAAALTAAEGAAAEDGMLMPFPGAAIDGSQETAADGAGASSLEAAPDASSTPAHEGSALPETAASARMGLDDIKAEPPAEQPGVGHGTSVTGMAEAVPAGLDGSTGTVAGATTSGLPTEQTNELRAEPDASAAGSRLLEALSGIVAGEPGLPAASAPVFAAEGCPRGLLKRLLAGAAGEADALSALAIELEILTLCRERQEIVTALFETEARLRELREATREPAPETLMNSLDAVPELAAEPVREPTVMRTMEASPLLTELTAPEGVAQEAPPSPRYGWFSIIGSAGALRAGVTDGMGVWFVREGDALPGAGTVAAIAGRPPGMRVTGAGKSGEAALLPYRARPGDGP